MSEATQRNWRAHGVRSRLAAVRLHRGIRQEDMAKAVGLSLTTYRRLEGLEMPNPPIRYLVNCAYVLDTQLVHLLEDEWVGWTRLRAGDPAEPPDPPRLGGLADRPSWPPA